MISKLMESIKSVGIGFLLFAASFPFIFWNECNAVAVYKSIDEGQKVAVTAPANKINSANEGKLVVVAGKADTNETLRDPDFGLSEKALKIVRSVEMYQWKEKLPSKKEEKKGEKPTYSKTWSSIHIDSSKFRKQTGHYNPPMGIKAKTTYAQNATLGAFRLKKDLLAKLSARDKIKIDAAKARSLRSPIAKPRRADGDVLYLGNPSDPQVGDYKITFKVARPQDATVLARQAGNSFTAWTAKNGKKLFNLRAGKHDATEMFNMERDDNFFWTMVKRVGAFMAMAFGLMLIFKPLAMVADMVPLIGNFLEAGINFFAILIAAFLTLFTIGIAWVAARPLFGIALLALGVAAIVGLVMLARKKKAAKADSPVSATEA